MNKIISAAEANRGFSHMPAGVRAGETFIVTNHGQAIAKVSPVEEESVSRQRAREVLFARLKSQKLKKAVRWTREELYKDVF